MSLLNQFKILPKGPKRSIIVGSVILPLIAGGLDTNFSLAWIPTTLIICVPAYWALTFAGIWIYMGFKEDEQHKINQP